MRKFRKKPVVIEAVRWTGENCVEMETFLGEHLPGEEELEDPLVVNQSFIIETLEGDVTAQVGDWIIKGGQGEFYPCKPDIFEATYELVEDEPFNIGLYIDED